MIHPIDPPAALLFEASLRVLWERKRSARLKSLGSSHQPLPSLIVRALRLVQRELADGEPVQLKHLAWVLDAIGEIVSWEDAGLADTVLRLMTLLNDRMRCGENWTTDEVNLKVTTVFAIDNAIAAGRREREAIAQLLPVVRRYLADVKDTTIEEWRRELRRQSNRGKVPPGATLRYHGGLPAHAGDTPQARFDWCLERLEREAVVIS